MNTKTKDLAKTTPHRELGLFEDMDRVFDSFFRLGWLRPFRELWPEMERLEEAVGFRAPRVEVIDQDTEMLVRAELPGIRREDLHVEMTEGRLTIHGEKRREEKINERNVLRSEIVHGTFSRTLSLPSGLDAEHVKAEFENGVLTVHLPKLETTERRQIEIS
jgi:HSP20 family protein